MEFVGAVLGNDLYLRAGIAAVLGVEVVSDDVELFDGVSRQGSGTAFPGGRDVSSGRIIDRDVVASSSASIGVETPQTQKGIIGSDRNDTRGIPRQRHNVIADQRQRGDVACLHTVLELRIYRVQRCRRLHHDDLLRGSGNFEHQRNRGRRPARDCRLGLEGIKSVSRNLDLVTANRELRDPHRTHRIGSPGAHRACVPTAYRDGGPGDHCRGRICNLNFEVAANLGERRSVGQRDAENERDERRQDASEHVFTPRLRFFSTEPLCAIVRPKPKLHRIARLDPRVDSEGRINWSG